MICWTFFQITCSCITTISIEIFLIPKTLLTRISFNIYSFNNWRKADNSLKARSVHAFTGCRYILWAVLNCNNFAWINITLGINTWKLDCWICEHNLCEFWTIIVVNVQPHENDKRRTSKLCLEGGFRLTITVEENWLAIVEGGWSVCKYLH